MKSVEVKMPDGSYALIDPWDTLAFSEKRAERLNQKITLLSPLLYCFAHYNPKGYDYDTYAPIFHQAYNNLYALLFDTGKLCVELAKSRNESKAQITPQDRKKLEASMGLIHDLRTYYDHNTSPALHSKNQQIAQRVDTFIGNPKTNADWGALLSKLLEACFSIESILATYFDAIPEAKKAQVAQWILVECVQKFLCHKDTLWAIIEGGYRNACRIPSDNAVSKRDLGFWIRNHVKICMRNGKYDVVDSRLSDLLKDSQSPTYIAFDSINYVSKYYDVYIKYLTEIQIPETLRTSDAVSLLPEEYFDTALKPLRSTPICL